MQRRQITLTTLMRSVNVVWSGHFETEVGFWNRWKSRFLLLVRMRPADHLPLEATTAATPQASDRAGAQGSRHLLWCVFDRKPDETRLGTEQLENFIPLSAFSNVKVSPHTAPQPSLM